MAVDGVDMVEMEEKVDVVEVVSGLSGVCGGRTGTSLLWSKACVAAELSPPWQRAEGTLNCEGVQDRNIGRECKRMR